MEPIKGTPEQNVKYCQKEGDFTEHGTIKKKNQGKRTDLHTFVECVRGGDDRRTVMKEWPMIMARHPQFYNNVRNTFATKRDWITDVRIFWGVTGSGKSHEARKVLGCKSIIYDGKFYLGYDQEEKVCFEEWEFNMIPYAELKRITDRYEEVVPIKGGEANWAPKLIVFTTNADPRAWLDAHPEFKRRVTEVRHFSVPYSGSGEE